MRGLKKIIEDLRREPEHVRVRKASVFTAIAGLGIGIIWITVLLPLQLKFTVGQDGKNEDTPEVAQEEAGDVLAEAKNDLLDSADSLRQPQVGGARNDNMLPISSPYITNEPSPVITDASSAPTPTVSPIVSPYVGLEDDEVVINETTPSVAEESMAPVKMTK